MSRLLIFDTETGGLSPVKHSLLSLGAVIWQDGNIIGEFSVDIAERKISVESAAMAINRIDLTKHALTAQSPLIAVQRFEEFISTAFPHGQRIPLAGHNVNFDIGFLKRLYRQTRKDYEARFSHRAIDTASVMGFLMLSGRLNLANPGLDAGLKHFGVKFIRSKRHSALEDARATALLLNALIEFEQRKKDIDWRKRGGSG